MDQESMQRCRTCPAFAKLPGAGRRRHLPGGSAGGRCRPRTTSAAPRRELPFGAFPVVGAFPLVTEDDYCMSHPGNRTKLM